MTLLRGTVTRQTPGRSLGRCPPVAAGSAVCLSSWGRTSTWAAALGHQMTTEAGGHGGISPGCYLHFHRGSCTTKLRAVEHSKLTMMPGFGVVLFELLLEAKIVVCFYFSITDCLWNGVSPLVWLQRKWSQVTGRRLSLQSVVTLYDVKMFRELVFKSVKNFPANIMYL